MKKTAIVLGVALLVTVLLILTLEARSRPEVHSLRGKSPQITSTSGIDDRSSDGKGIDGVKEKNDKRKASGEAKNTTRGAEERVRPWLREFLASQDEADARERFVARFQHEAEDSSSNAGGTRWPALKAMMLHPSQYSILMKEQGLFKRDWDVLTKVNAELQSSALSDAEKQKLGDTFLRIIGEGDLARSLASDVAGEALEVQSRVASIEEARELRKVLGTSFTENQAQEVAYELRGLVSGQSHLFQMAALRARPIYMEFNQHEQEIISRGFQAAVREKRSKLKHILTAEQFRLLYGEHGYDSLSYWRKRAGATLDGK